jgi:hypothetical protein
MVERVLAVAIRLLPRRRRELGKALLAEAGAVPPRKRVAWLAGGLWFVAKENLMRVPGYVWGLLGAVVVLVLLDQVGGPDIGGQVSMLTLVLGAGILGFAAPKRAWVTALVLGSALAITGIIANIIAPSWMHTPDPHGIGGALSLFVLVVPAAIAAYFGVAMDVLRRRSHS